MDNSLSFHFGMVLIPHKKTTLQLLSLDAWKNKETKKQIEAQIDLRLLLPYGNRADYIIIFANFEGKKI